MLAGASSRYPGQSRSLPDLNYRTIPLQLQGLGTGLIIIRTLDIFRFCNVIIGITL
jgi:hypothetical protein